MKRLPLLLLVVLSLVFLTLVIPLFVIHPSLYNAYKDASTPYHTNPAILGEYSEERAADISALMQDLLDAPQPIVLNIKVKDFEEAERAFEEYKGKSQYFNQVVINLDLTESAIGDLQRENRRNLATLERIINESVQFDQINRLEIQYRSEDDPALLYTITYEGEAVQKAIDKNTKEYLDREPKIVNLSNQLDLDTTKYNESGEILKEILDEDLEKQETRNLNQPVLSPSNLSLSLSPDLGYYGDTLQVAGAYTFMRLPEVTLVLDSRDWKTVVPDQNGVFGSLLTIGRIRPGDHFVFATSNNHYSNIATFSVVPADTSLTLDTFPGEHWNEVYIDGSLYAGLLPVTAAPVMVLIDEFDVMTVETDEDGFYSAMLPLSPGNHTLQSSFGDTAFPLNPTVSDIHAITVSPTNRLPWSVLIGIGIIFVSIFISIWYLRRSDETTMRLSREPPKPESVFVPVETMVKPTFQDDVLVRYQTLFDNREWSEAAHLLYRSFIERIEPLHIPDLSAMTLTPRELFSLVFQSFPEAPVRSFINRYEEIRYGGYPLLPQDPLLTDWVEISSYITEEGNA